MKKFGLIALAIATLMTMAFMAAPDTLISARPKCPGPSKQCETTTTTSTTLAPETSTSTTLAPEMSTTSTTNTSTTSTSTTSTTTVPSSPWNLILSEDFNTDVALGGPLATTYPRIGWYPSNYYDTSKKGQYNAATTVSVTAGVLTKHLHTRNGVPQVAAMVPYIVPPDATHIWPGQAYGRYSIRARFPAPIPGYKIAWLLWPDKGTNTTGSPSGTGGNGEIDFPETNLDTITSVGGFVHYQDATVGSDQYAMPRASVDMSQWHEYTIEWSPNLVRFLLDGREVGRTTTRVPYTKMHWVVQTETKLTSTYPDPAVSGDVQIDWVRVWSYAP